jgi:hypothetical protein
MNPCNAALRTNRMKIILIALPALIVVFLIIAALQPADYKVVRSTAIAAPPDAVFAHINDLHKFQNWSPWAKVDANCQYTYEGPPTGAGSAFSWKGNSAVGAGKMTITESRADQVVRARLDFYKPFEGVGEAEYALTPTTGNTTVTWTMIGKKNFMTKAIGLFVSMDKMLGPQFEKGLATLKAIAEGPDVVAAAR